MVEVLIPISVFAMSFGVAYIAIMSSHREKMSMLEKGINPQEFENERKKNRDGRKGAMVLIAVGLGLALGSVIQESDSIPGHDVAIPSLICIFIGLALFLHHQIAKKKA